MTDSKNREKSSAKKRRAIFAAAATSLTALLGTTGLTALFAKNSYKDALANLPIHSQENIYQTDKIVVFTGGADRIKTGLNMALETGKPILISGCNRDTSFNDLCHANDVDPALFDNHSVQIDYADDTQENVAAVVRLLNKEQDINGLTIITSFAHAPRVQELLESAGILKKCNINFNLVGHIPHDPSLTRALNYYSVETGINGYKGPKLKTPK